MSSLFLFFFPLIFTSLCNSCLAMSTISAIAKDQISCSMCSSCDNPCQPILSPPPIPSPPPPPPVPSPPPPSPPIVSSPPPPSLPPPTGPDCPPPPMPPITGPDCPPPPYGVGGVYYPPSNPYGTPAPPNPIVPYFPYYYNSPPPPSSQSNNLISMQFRFQTFLSLLVFLFSLCHFL